MKIIEKIGINDNTKKITKIDLSIIIVLTLIYGILSFIKLGDTKVPLTYKDFDNESNEIIVTLNDVSNINRMRYYTGNNLGEINVFFSLDGDNYKDITSIKIDSVFAWNDIYLNGVAKYIKFVSTSETGTLGEVKFYDNYDRVIPMIIDINNPLTDEIDLVPDEINYMNSTYFDEIYYARSAYEYVNKINCYEWTHPPLGKLLIAIPIALFGFSPFNYRLMGNIFGILLIPIMYVLAKKIFKNSKWAILAALLMTFDNFHFAHTRIALIDVFQICFILLSVIFMKEYIDLEKNDNFKKKFKYLLLSGTFIGCALATKWNAAYACLGLAIVFFIHLLKQYNFNVITFFKKNITVNNVLKYLLILVFIPYALYYLSFMFFDNIAKTLTIVYYIVISLFLIIQLFIFIYKDKYLFKLFIVSCISFIWIPIIIYISSYIFFPTISYYDGSLKGILDISKMMYDYHANLNATHPFSSVWYQWPIMYKPVWLYTNNTLSGLKRTITDIGNPAIWWIGILAFIYLVISLIKNRDQNNILILIFILTTFIPYVFIGRIMYMYHYFITLPFVMLGITTFIKWITDKTQSNKVYYSYITLVIITFIIFYPIVSGIPIKSEYIDALKWLTQWHF